MANDDTGKIGRADASNTPNADEPRILEEHIVAAPPAPPRAVEPPTPAAVPIVSAPPQVVPIVKAGVPTPSAPAPAPTIPVQPIQPSKPLETQPPITPPTQPPAQPASSPLISPTEPTDVQTDITRILEGIKLPARKDEKPTAQKQFDTTLATETKDQSAQTAALDAARSITETLQQKERGADVQALHTLKDDLQHVVRDKKISLVRAVALEEEKRHRTITNAAPVERSSRTRFVLFFILLLLVIGGLALGSVLYVMQDRASQTPQFSTSSLLFAEQTVPFPVDSLSPADLRREIAVARGGGLTLGAILQIVPVTNSAAGLAPLSFDSFLKALGARAPEELSRALSDEFFFGFHTVDENAPLMVIPVKSYERAFAAMLEWESLMNQDLSPIFASVPPQAIGQNGLPIERTFEDTVMRNYDVRALKDDAGVIQLYYSFPTRNILIIAESQYSFTEILSRLRADRRL